MEKQAYNEELIVQYLLGSLPEEETERFDELCFVDDEFAEKLSAVENDLVDKYMQPLRALIGGATQALVSPDEALNLIPFEALVDEQDRYLIERYSFTYLTSGRDLLRLQVERESKSAPLIVADPLFGEPGQLAKADVPKRQSPSRMRLRQSVTTGSDLSIVYFAPLMGTALEAREIKSQFPEARALLGDQATEAQLKQAVAP